MIAKIVQGRGFKGVVNYLLDKKDARLLFAEGVRLKDKASVIQSFIAQSKLKPKISKPVAHISLDFSVQDKGRLTDKFMVDVAHEYLDKMGYANTQYIIARHHDTDHPHIHLVINRIDNEGNRISDKNEKLRNTKICMELTKKYGLYIASGKENVKEHRLKEPDKTKYEIYRVLQTAIPKCRNWKELDAKLRKSGITTELRRNGSTDKIQGVRFGKNGYEFNGSKIDRAFSYSKISYQLQQNDRKMLIQREPTHWNSQGNNEVFFSAVGTTVSSLGGLFDILNPSSGYDEDRAEYLRQEAMKKKRRKKGRRL
ncbi:Relaxase/Mobilisation nuclease domain-containing protein [Mariniphaga anaerophila]|uniref:Relaxase/Mobilisation nuclease domain-containing protein n=1 Tax=Mariniphaga anaerophila TaxID=1484053 RepID=A0A1M5BTE3_9BACT|nr:relaxase/mobilization nuclease domain-containing protein [Mariniphaga anaerophila]SHF45844.1 Relaxase/Mobilisation nuclease domain-containing protein [Mariniphaga anaerophila]